MPTILERAYSIKEYCTQCRRHIHMNPELSLQEFKTTEFIKRELSAMGVPTINVDLAVGVVAVIEGKKAGKGAVTALRADMDALAMDDLSGAPYASKTPGAAHTCGHDGHTAILLGVARVLNDLRDSFSGTVKLVFQPGEEGRQGSLLIIRSGALNNPDVETIVCLHAWPQFKAGEIGAWPGQYMASSDRFQVHIMGKSGHAASPYKAKNPITPGVLAIVALQNIVSNEIQTSRQAVITVSNIHAGTALNVIPDTLTFGGVVRCLDEHVRDELEERIHRTIEGAAATLGCTAEIEYKRGQPSLHNDPGVVTDILKAAETALGAGHVRPLDGPVMGAEDFSNLIMHVGKGALFRLGVGKEGEEAPAVLHNSFFDFNDDAIPYGVAAMVQYVIDKHQ